MTQRRGVFFVGSRIPTVRGIEKFCTLGCILVVFSSSVEVGGYEPLM